MKTTTIPAFAGALLLLCLAIAPAGTAATVQTTALFPSQAPLDRAAMSEEGLDSYARQIARVDLSQATRSEIIVPAGSVLQGMDVDGEFVLSAVPSNPMAMAANVQHPGQTADCFNDVVNYWYGTAYPATLNPTWPISSNFASLGLCGGSLQFGPLSLFTFSATTDYAGAADAYDYTSGSYFFVACYPTGSVTSVGVGPQWTSLVSQGGNSYCYVYMVGLPPTQFTQFDGWVYNAAYFTGTVYASYS